MVVGVGRGCKGRGVVVWCAISNFAGRGVYHKREASGAAEPPPSSPDLTYLAPFIMAAFCATDVRSCESTTCSVIFLFYLTAHIELSIPHDISIVRLCH